MLQDIMYICNILCNKSENFSFDAFKCLPMMFICVTG